MKRTIIAMTIWISLSMVICYGLYFTQKPAVLLAFLNMTTIKTMEKDISELTENGSSESEIRADILEFCTNELGYEGLIDPTELVNWLISGRIPHVRLRRKIDIQLE